MSKTMFTLTRQKFGQTFTWDEWYAEFEKGKNHRRQKVSDRRIVFDPP